MKTFDVKVVHRETNGVDSIVSGQLSVESKGDSPAYTFKLSYNDSIIEGNGSTGFEALLRIREKLEQSSHFILCAGAARNAVMSNMSFSAGGLTVCMAQSGKNLNFEDNVFLLDEISINQVGTTIEQKEFIKNWRKSIGIAGKFSNALSATAREHKYRR